MQSGQDIIYAPPLVHQGHLVYPGPLSDNFALATSVAVHYRHYSKLILHSLKGEQFDFAFATVLPSWHLTHLSLQDLHTDTVRKIISIVNFDSIKQLVLVDLSSDSYNIISSRLATFILTSSQVIKVIARDPEWQSHFDHLFEQTSVRHLEHVKSINVDLSTRITTLEASLAGLRQATANLKKEFELKLEEKNKKIKELKTEVTESAKKIEEEKNKRITVKNELKSEITSAQSIFNALKATQELQLQEALEHHAETEAEKSELQSEIKSLKDTISEQRRLRARDKQLYKSRIKNEAIIYEAIHVALTSKSHKRRRSSVDSSASSSSSSSSSSSDSSSSTSSENSSFDLSSAINKIPNSHTFFTIKLRRTSHKWALNKSYEPVTLRSR